MSTSLGLIKIEAHSVDEPTFRQKCNCDTLNEYITYYRHFIQEVFKYAKLHPVEYPLPSLVNYTWINDNQTTIGNYPAQQYEFVNQFKGKTVCDYPIMRNYGILTKVGKILYNIEYDSCDKPEVYDKFLPELKKIFNSIEFLPIRSAVVGDIGVPNQPLTTGSDIVQILSHNSFIDTLGFLHVVGEVKNNSPSQAKFVEIVGTFYDSNNGVVGTHSTYTNPSDMSPGVQLLLK